ncbi:p21-C-terminal region-binding protein-domain-containing protein [Gymnopilus junonius]|uniref:Protein BCP1 n=1 Tax=Gymnopilus junonius TaxID=109634 RepID=A0A9P5TQX3_GYMJU|nr:p21-C-terminal region-binding protein-domain-containing protein [Gymnopilus junonius]
MPKRKQDSDDDGNESSSSDVSLVDVSFEFFDPNPNVDYHAIKRLLTQLFQRDAEQLHTHELTELVLAQPTVGTTIKTDGIESDPFALFTVLNMHLHHQNTSVKAIANYLLSVTEAHDPPFHATLKALFSQSEAHVGLVLCERLVNMPVQVVPPMYNMLADEVKWANADGEPYQFTHLIFISRVYHLSEEEESQLANKASARRRPETNSSVKKQKKQRPEAEQNEMARPADGVYPFHPEDDIVSKAALHSLTYPYVSPLPPLVQETRSRDTFGLDIRGRMMLVVGGGEMIRDLGGRMATLYGTG